MPKELKNFFEFVREQGVVGLAVGIILGGSVSRLVSALVENIVTPLLGLVLGSASNLVEAYVMVGKAKIGWGGFVNAVIDFVVIAAVVYYGVKLLGLEKADKKK